MADNARAPFQWGAAIDETFGELSQQFVQYFPQLLGTATLLLLGWILAKALALSARKLVEGLDALFVRYVNTESIQRERIQRSYALIISKLVFWVVMVFFLAVGANILGWDLFTGWLDKIVGYLPGLVTGLLIILGGFLLSNVAKAGIISASQRIGSEQSRMMARAVQIVIIFSSIIIGVEQIGLNVGFLSNIIVVVVAIGLAGAALAFSLGAKNLVANVIGAQYTRRHCRVGDQLKIGDVQGEILRHLAAFAALCRAGQTVCHCACDVARIADGIFHRLVVGDVAGDDGQSRRKRRRVEQHFQFCSAARGNCQYEWDGLVRMRRGDVSCPGLRSRTEFRRAVHHRDDCIAYIDWRRRRAVGVAGRDRNHSSRRRPAG